MNRCKYVEVQVAMIRNGFNRADIADKIGMSRNTFNNKMNGKYEWTLKEAYTICKVLNIPPTALPQYFPEEV